MEKRESSTDNRDRGTLSVWGSNARKVTNTLLKGEQSMTHETTFNKVLHSLSLYNEPKQQRTWKTEHNEKRNYPRLHFISLNRYTLLEWGHLTVTPFPRIRYETWIVSNRNCMRGFPVNSLPVIQSNSNREANRDLIFHRGLCPFSYSTPEFEHTRQSNGWLLLCTYKIAGLYKKCPAQLASAIGEKRTISVNAFRWQGKR
jgi:hypothetical protein